MELSAGEGDSKDSEHVSKSPTPIQKPSWEAIFAITTTRDDDLFDHRTGPPCKCLTASYRLGKLLENLSSSSEKVAAHVF